MNENPLTTGVRQVCGVWSQFPGIVSHWSGRLTCSCRLFCGLWLALRFCVGGVLGSGRGFSGLHFLGRYCFWKTVKNITSGFVVSTRSEWDEPPTALRFSVRFYGGGDFLLRRAVAFVGAGAVLGFGFSLGLRKFGLVEQVVDLSVQKGQFGLDVFGQQDGPFLGGALLLLRYRLVFPGLQQRQMDMKIEMEPPCAGVGNSCPKDHARF